MDLAPLATEEAVKEAVTKFLTKDALLKRREVKVETVEVPQLGESIYVKVLTAREVGKYSVEFIGDEEHKTQAAAAFKYKFVGRCLCNENGQLLFSEEEIENLGDLPAREIEHLFNAVSKVNPLGNEKEVEKEAKNSEKTED